MKIYYAIELWKSDARTIQKLYFRSDLYRSPHQAIAAFKDLETMTLYEALQDVLTDDEPSITLAGDYWEADDLAVAYSEGIPEVVDIVTKLQKAADYPHNDCPYGITIRIEPFATHEEEPENIQGEENK